MRTTFGGARYEVMPTARGLGPKTNEVSNAICIGRRAKMGSRSTRPGELGSRGVEPWGICAQAIWISI